jgi:hypothetical protein
MTILDKGADREDGLRWACGDDFPRISMRETPGNGGLTAYPVPRIARLTFLK